MDDKSLDHHPLRLRRDSHAERLLLQRNHRPCAKPSMERTTEGHGHDVYRELHGRLRERRTHVVLDVLVVAASNQGSDAVAGKMKGNVLNLRGREKGRQQRELWPRCGAEPRGRAARSSARA